MPPDSANAIAGIHQALDCFAAIVEDSRQVEAAAEEWLGSLVAPGSHPEGGAGLPQ